MKVLLVGGNSSLAKALRPKLELFADVVTAGRTGCDIELDMAWPLHRFELAKGFDTVVHLAAHFGGQDINAMLDAEEVNVLGALKLAHACSCADVGHLLQVSSIFAGLSEESPFYSSYALSKRHAEEVTRLYCQREKLPLTIIRPAQLYGDGEDFRRHQPFLFTLMDKAQRGEEIVLYGNNDAQRNFIHVQDVAEVFSRVVRNRIEGRYNCGSLLNARFSEIAAAAVTAFGSTSTVRFDTTKADIPDNAFAADDSLYKLIDYFPCISLAEGLAREAKRRQAQL